ncbi:MAG: glycosyltransferase family 4 protein, partial [Gemmatimonadaceae bacterium]
MKIAIVHDYLNQAGGAERVVGTLHTMFPKAPIFTTILDRSSLWDVLRDADIRTSWMQKLPLLKRHFKAYLLFYPGAIERFDLR